MRCPYCGHAEDRVIDSRVTRESQEIRRRRECAECNRRFTTRERVDVVVPRILKRDERREDYERAKLLRGVEKAFAKRPISENAIQRLVDRVERRLQESPEAEVSTAWVGELVLEQLLSLDAVAAARYASVFRRFESSADWADFFDKEVEASGAPRAPAGPARNPEGT